MGETKAINLDSVSFYLKEKHDFDWLRNLGKVFCIFDEQDSGNISFGIEKDGVKKFVKYAGARITQCVIALSGALNLRKGVATAILLFD
ncbi:hypothetical protein SAMN05444673_3164 [Bacillus sp. OV166]|nr:hypothetical protein SAMN05444673_3164 [Bacillus sp. OV166]